MLKRQRPTTPPPASLGDLPSFLPDGPIRPLQPLHTADTSQPRSKRQRTQPPPLDGALRGWMTSQSTDQRWESDGEEDWIEDPNDESWSLLPPSTNQYKDANSLLHELHVFNQHRLLFSQPLRDQPLNPDPRPPATYAYLQEPIVGHRSAPCTYESPYRPGHPHITSNGVADQSRCIETGKGLVGEVQCVRQHYEGTNRLIGSLFLSRRREVEGIPSSADRSPSG